MEHASWAAVNREDGEVVGYLNPVDSTYDQVLPRNLLGHPAANVCELAETWSLDGSAHPGFTIVEVSRQGIVVADALVTKALAPTERHLIAWPDTNLRLTR